MEMLFYRYRSICEPDVIDAFQKIGYTVIEKRSDLEKKKESDLIRDVAVLIENHDFEFIFSINYFPYISELCRIYGIRYVCWTVDVPVLELFSPTLANKTNRVFLFDYSQYQYFKDRNPDNIYYLPLATNPDRWDSVLLRASSAVRRKYTSDISFVGSLYSEKNPYRMIEGLSEYTKGYLQGVIDAQLNIYGVNFIQDMLNDELMEEMSRLVPDMHDPLYEENEEAQKYMIAHCFIGYELAQTERYRLLKELSEQFDVDLYTFSGAEVLPKIHSHGTVDSLNEMPIVFNESRINLNITMRPIATGLSLRLYDVCGCGGFLLTNWQDELPELYEPGVEVETFSSKDEMIDKVRYYLAHDDERAAIAKRGYERTKAEHTYEMRIREMLKIIS